MWFFSRALGDCRNALLASYGTLDKELKLLLCMRFSGVVWAIATDA